jgi:hypothetical protein
MIATTTLNKLRAHNPCTSGWKKPLAHLGKTHPDDITITREEADLVRDLLDLWGATRESKWCKSGCPICRASEAAGERKAEVFDALAYKVTK